MPFCGLYCFLPQCLDSRWIACPSRCNLPPLHPKLSQEGYFNRSQLFAVDFMKPRCRTSGFPYVSLPTAALFEPYFFPSPSRHTSPIFSALPYLIKHCVNEIPGPLLGISAQHRGSQPLSVHQRPSVSFSLFCSLAAHCILSLSAPTLIIHVPLAPCCTFLRIPFVSRRTLLFAI